MIPKSSDFTSHRKAAATNSPLREACMHGRQDGFADLVVPALSRDPYAAAFRFEKAARRPFAKLLTAVVMGPGSRPGRHESMPHRRDRVGNRDGARGHLGMQP